MIFDIASNQLKTKSETSKKDIINTLDSWGRAFLVFAMYRIAINPFLPIPLLRYFDHFCMLADPKRKIPFSQLLNYDRLFRSLAAGKLSDHKVWITRNEKAYLEFLDPSVYAVGIEDHSGKEQTLRKTFRCSWCQGEVTSEKNAPPSTPNPNHLLAGFFGPAPSEAGQIKSPARCVSSVMQADAPVIPAPHASTIVSTDVSTATKLTPASTALKKGLLIPPSILTPLRRSAFQRFLRNHPDQIFVRNLLDILLSGADIGFRGPQFTRTTPNFLSACQHFNELKKPINSEFSLCHTIGPFQKAPFKNLLPAH